MCTDEIFAFQLCPSPRCADLPENFHFHDLRHTANTITAAAGDSTAELMHRMGHASSAAALRYSTPHKKETSRSRDDSTSSSRGGQETIKTVSRDGRPKLRIGLELAPRDIAP